MTEYKPGFRRIGSLLGVPILADWTFPLNVLFAGIFVCFEIRYMSGLMAWSLFFTVWHLLVYAIAAKCCRLHIKRVYISLINPDCEIQFPQSVSQNLAIASSRIVSLILLFIVEIIFLRICEIPSTGLAADLVEIFTLINAVWLLFCVVPWQFSDGSATDSLLIYRLLRYSPVAVDDPFEKFNLVPVDQSPVFSPGTSLLTKPELIPEGFDLGVEILNDSKTPMVFVVDVLVNFFDLEQTDAFEWMATIHNTGGILAKLPTLEKATEVAKAITAEANLRGHPLVCRVVDVRKNTLGDTVDG